MSKNVCDEVIPEQNTDKIEAKFADIHKENELNEHLQNIARSLKAQPLEYDRMLTALQAIYELIQEPSCYFVQDNLYKSVNSISKKVHKKVHKKVQNTITNDIKQEKNISNSSSNHENLKEEILHLTLKLNAVAQLRVFNIKDATQGLEKIIEHSAKSWKQPDKICQVGKTLAEISHTLKSSFFDNKLKQNEQLATLKELVNRKKETVAEEFHKQLTSLLEDKHYKAAEVLAEKWLREVEERPAIFKLLAKVCEKQTNEIELQNLDLPGKQEHFVLLKKAAECYIKAIKVQLRWIDECTPVINIIKKLGELKTPEAQEVSLTSLEEVKKWAIELDNDIYVGHIGLLIKNIEADNANKNEEIYDTLGMNQLSPTTRMYPELFTERAENLDISNNNFAPLIPTSPIPATRNLFHIMPSSLATPTPEQENKSLAQSISQNDLNATLSPAELKERRAIMKILKHIGILDDLNQNEKIGQLQLGVTAMKNAMEDLNLSPADLIPKLYRFSLKEKLKINELVAMYHQSPEICSTPILGINPEISE